MVPGRDTRVTLFYVFLGLWSFYSFSLSGCLVSRWLDSRDTTTGRNTPEVPLSVSPLLRPDVVHRPRVTFSVYPVDPPVTYVSRHDPGLGPVLRQTIPHVFPSQHQLVLVGTGVWNPRLGRYSLSTLDRVFSRWHGVVYLELWFRHNKGVK